MIFKRFFILAIFAGFLLPMPAHAQLGFFQKISPENIGQDRAKRVFSIEQQAQTDDLQGAIQLAEKMVAEDSQRTHSFNPLAAMMPGVQQSARLAAKLHVRAREYERAIELYQIVLDSVSPALAATGPRLTMSVKMDLALAHEKMGNLQLARKIYEGVLAAMDQKNPYLLERLKLHSELGRLTLAENDLIAARRYLVLAIDDSIQMTGEAVGGRKILPANGSGFMGAMNNLVNVEALIKESVAGLNSNRDVMDANGQRVGSDGAVEMAENSLMTKQSPFTNLAEVFRRESDHASLKALYEQSFNNYARARQSTPDVAGNQAGNAELEWLYVRLGAHLAGAGLDAQAHEAFGNALRLNALRVASTAKKAVPELLGPTLASRREILGVYLSFALSQHPQNPDVMRKLVGEIMQAKALEGERLGERSRVIGLSGDTELQKLFQRMGEAPANSSERIGLTNKLQGPVSRLMPPLQFENGEVFVDRLAGRVADEVVISIFQFFAFDFKKLQFDVPHYLGTLLAHDKMSVVDLGVASDVNVMISRARAEIAKPEKPLAARPDSMKALYVKLLQPLMGPSLPRGRYIADMDGAINLMPLEILVDATGHFLIEQGSWRYVSSARAILREQHRIALSNESLVLVNPDFNADASTKTDPATAVFFQRSTTLRAAGGENLKDVHFNPLPETMEEGQAVAAAMRRLNSRVEMVSGADGTPKILHRARAPRFLHIATHGFFLEDAGTTRQEGTTKDGRKFIFETRDPGLSSGLALAGANSTIGSGQGDGILFSSNIRQLNLQGTELVVLSACDTGVGAIKVGEGVDSLRQALELAGARTTVTSLWKVPSLATRDLMIAFYDAMAGGTSKSEAMRQAKIQMIKKMPQPLYWGAFVVSGMD